MLASGAVRRRQRNKMNGIKVKLTVPDMIDNKIKRLNTKWIEFIIRRDGTK